MLASLEVLTKAGFQGTPEPKSLQGGWKLSPEEKVLALDFLKDEPAISRQRSQEGCVST